MIMRSTEVFTITSCKGVYCFVFFFTSQILESSGETQPWQLTTKLFRNVMFILLGKPLFCLSRW